MNTYKASFKMTAQVEVVIEVQADNQQEALAASFDKLQEGLAPVSIISVDYEYAQNTGLAVVEQEKKVVDNSVCNPASPLDSAGTHSVLLYRDRDTSTFEKIEVEGFVKARAIAEAADSADSEYAKAIVLDSGGYAVLTVNSRHGGWEVLVTYKDGQSRNISWLASNTEAKKTALQNVLKPDVAKVEIFDFSNRRLGRIKWKEIQ